MCIIAWLQGVSQYFKLCQDALKSIVNISLQCLYKRNPIYLKGVWGKSCTSEHSRKNQSEYKNTVMVIPSQTRGPSATVSDGGQNWRPAKEIKNRTSVFDTSPCTLLPTSNLWLRAKIYFRDFSSVKLPSCSLNSSTVRAVEQGFWQFKTTVCVESLCFIYFEVTNCYFHLITCRFGTTRASCTYPIHPPVPLVVLQTYVISYSLFQPHTEAAAYLWMCFSRCHEPF